MNKPAQKAAPAAATKPTLAELTARWATAKAAEELAKREAETLRAEILADPAAVSGFENEHVKIGSTSKLDLEDKRLLAILRDEEVLKDVTETRVSTELLRAVAKLNERVARAVERASTSSPRLEQVRKK